MSGKPIDDVVQALIEVAAGKVQHLYRGTCPDAIEGFGSRDPQCPACQVLIAAQQPAAVDEAMVERIAALLHEEATGEPWAVAGVAHPGPDRDYYRGLARKVAALAAQQQEPKS